MEHVPSSLREKFANVVGTKLGFRRLLDSAEVPDEARNGGVVRVAQDEECAYEKIDGEVPDTLSGTKRTEIWGNELEVPEHVHVGTSSFWEATMNTVSLLFGMGMLALPYAAEQGGWSSLSLLLIFAVLCCYTGCILGSVMKEDRRLNTYQEIAGSALGMRGRLMFTVLLYLEILACLVGFTISVGDNLERIFESPGLGFHVFGFYLKPSTFLVSLAMLVVAPTVLVRDLSYVAYLSFGSIVTSLIIVGAVVWTGIFKVGFAEAIPFARLGRWRLILGLYAYCYSGHPIIPSIYSSMREPSKFPQMLILSFTVATAIYGGLALMGAAMFGKETLSQITLNIPRNLTAATIVLWTTVLTPLSKFSLGVTPIATELEALLPYDSDSRMHWVLGSLVRICILLFILAVAVAFPFFGRFLALIGSSIAIATSIILPCTFHLILQGRRMSKAGIVLDGVIIAVALSFSVIGTWSSSHINA